MSDKNEININKEVRKRVFFILSIIFTVIALIIILLLLINNYANKQGDNKKSYQFKYDNSLITSETSLVDDKYLTFISKSDDNLYEITTTISSDDNLKTIGPVGISNAYIYYAKGESNGNINISFTILDINNSSYIDKKLISDLKYEIYIGEENKTLIENYFINKDTYDLSLSLESEIYLNSFFISFKI